MADDNEGLAFSMAQRAIGESTICPGVLTEPAVDPQGVLGPEHVRYERGIYLTPDQSHCNQALGDWDSPLSEPGPAKGSVPLAACWLGDSRQRRGHGPGAGCSGAQGEDRLLCVLINAD